MILTAYILGSTFKIWRHSMWQTRVANSTGYHIKCLLSLDDPRPSPPPPPPQPPLKIKTCTLVKEAIRIGESPRAKNRTGGIQPEWRQEPDRGHTTWVTSTSLCLPLGTSLLISRGQEHSLMMVLDENRNCHSRWFFCGGGYDKEFFGKKGNSIQMNLFSNFLYIAHFAYVGKALSLDWPKYILYYKL